MSIVGTILGLYGAVTLAAWAGQRKLLYPAPQRAETPVMDGATVTETQGPHGRTVRALYSPAPAGGVTAAFFHGNSEEIADVVPLAWAFRRAGVGFFAVEYPGYGLSRDYESTETTLTADAEAALWHLHNKLGVATADVVVVGQSLGTGVATEMARRGHGTRLVLISPFTSVPDMARTIAPFLPVRWLVKDRFDNAAKAPEITVPVLIVHGTADEIVPVEMGKKLAQRFPSATTYWVEGGHHNDLFVKDGRIVVDRIAAFVKGEYVSP